MTNYIMIGMLKIRCSLSRYNIVRGDFCDEIYPYLRDENGDKVMYCVSPLHGRSFVVCKNSDGRYVVSKGNGLSYTQYQMLHTKEFFDGTWGLLLRQDAERDFILGQEIKALGIKTNNMEYVLELEKNILLPNGHTVKPVLLQYNVECPYRISDAPFMKPEQIQAEVAKWEKMNDRGFEHSYMVAANVLVRNLRILHDNGVLHNALNEQNYTWALELVDFELACSPKHPYTKEDDRRHVKDLFPREIIQTYVIINYIAGALGEDIDFTFVDSLFAEYGFDLKQYVV